MLLEKLTPGAFGMLVTGIFAVVLYLLRDRFRPNSYNRLKGWKNFLLFITPVILVIVYPIVRYIIVFEPRFTQFDAHMSEYTSVTTQQPGAWYLNGKVLPIDMSNNEVDVNIYYEMPDSMRPLTPEEVSMVLWMDCTQRNVGSYTQGGAAQQWFCQVTLVDMTIPAVIGEMSFEGSEPPITNPGSSSQSGSFPAKDIIEYLENQPAE